MSDLNYSEEQNPPWLEEHPNFSDVFRSLMHSEAMSAWFDSVEREDIPIP